MPACSRKSGKTEMQCRFLHFRFLMMLYNDNLTRRRIFDEAADLREERRSGVFR